MSIKIQSHLTDKIKAYTSAYKTRLKGILGLMARNFAVTALEYSPPGITSKEKGIQADLQTVRISIVKLEAKIIDKGQIEKIIEDKLSLHEAKYHGK